MMNFKSLCLISKDKRTEMLFRASWIEAAREEKIKITTKRRKEKNFFFLADVLLKKLMGFRIISFGVSEALFLCWLKPQAIVITGFGRLLHKESKYRKFFFFLLLFFYKNSLVVCLNRDDFKIIKALGFKSVHQIKGEGFKSKRGQNGNLLKKGDFLYIGRLLKTKGVSLLIDSFLESNLKNKTLNIVGDHDFFNSDSLTQKEIDSYIENSKGSIRFFGFEKDLSKFYSNGAVYISASKREGMPFSVLEALDAGLNCILSKVPGHKEFKNFSNVSFFSGKDELKKLLSKNFYKSSQDDINDNLLKYKKEAVKKSIKKIYKELL